MTIKTYESIIYGLIYFLMIFITASVVYANAMHHNVFQPVVKQDIEALVDHD